MTIWTALLLGLVQGLSEFLPISSSGHLVLLNTLFGIHEGVMTYSILLHAGTLIAVIVAYRRTLRKLIRHPIRKYTGMLLVATAVTAVLYVLLNDLFESAFAGNLLGIGFLVTAILLTVTDCRRPKKTYKVEGRPWYSAILVGLLQGVAMLPGVSRSGSTIAGASFLNISRKNAATFSFILSIPVILGSLVVEIPDAIRAGENINWLYAFAGMAVAAVSGYFAIKAVQKLLTKKKFWPFAIYTALLGALVLVDQLVTNFFFANPFA